MSFTNSTQNYGLPQFIGTDIPSWLRDFNGAMKTIDDTMKDISDETVKNGNAGNNNAADIATLQTNVSGITANMETLTTEINEIDTNYKAADSGLSVRITNNSTAINNLDARVDALEGGGEDPTVPEWGEQLQSNVNTLKSQMGSGSVSSDKGGNVITAINRNIGLRTRVTNGVPQWTTLQDTAGENWQNFRKAAGDVTEYKFTPTSAAPDYTFNIPIDHPISMFYLTTQVSTAATELASVLWVDSNPTKYIMGGADIADLGKGSSSGRANQYHIMEVTDTYVKVYFYSNAPSVCWYI